MRAFIAFVILVASSSSYAQAPSPVRDALDLLAEKCAPHYYGRMPNAPAQTEDGWSFCKEVLAKKAARDKERAARKETELDEARRLFEGIK